MKEVEVLFGIFFIVVGGIIFEMNLDYIGKFFGLALLSIGVTIYIHVIDSLNAIKKKRN